MAKIKAQELLDKIEEGVKTLEESDRWAEYLGFLGRFHNYSWGNRMLIWLQMPEASHVAGYRAWQKMDRQVRKGESGIAILAPCAWRKTVEDDDGEEHVESGIYFKTVYVFDISQTDGDPVPAPTTAIEGEDRADLLEAVWEAMQADGLDVDREAMTAWHGYTTPDGKVRLNSGDSVNQNAKTALHEWAHQLLGHFDREDAGRDLRELEAESVAYIVSDRMGFDTGEYSFGYLLSWGGTSDDVSDLLKDALDRIVEVAEEITGRIAERLPQAMAA